MKRGCANSQLRHHPIVGAPRCHEPKATRSRIEGEQSKCQLPACPLSTQNEATRLRDDSQSAGTLSTVMFGATAVFAAGGAALLLLAPSSRKGAAWLQPTVGGVRARFEF